MNTGEFEFLSDEVICNILKNITDADDMVTILETNVRLNRLGKACFNEILSSSRKSIPISFILNLPYLTKVRIPIMINNKEEGFDLANHPRLSDMVILLKRDYRETLDFLDLIVMNKINFRIHYKRAGTEWIITPNSLITDFLKFTDYWINLIDPETVFITRTVIYTDADKLQNLKSLKSLKVYINENVAYMANFIRSALRMPSVNSIQAIIPSFPLSSIRYNQFFMIISESNLSSDRLKSNLNLEIYDVPLAFWNLPKYMTLFPNVKEFTVVIENIEDINKLGNYDIKLKVMIPIDISEDYLIDYDNVTYEYIE